MSKILDGLEPEIVWDIFERISAIPRCSKKEEGVQEFLEAWAGENGVGFNKDKVGNVILIREAAPGCESYPTLMMQGHQDMVCEKNPESPHDFDVDPIPLKVEGDNVSAEGTTLGADNGIGMAIAMALLVDPSLERHGKLEAVFTVDEESGFTGIRNMSPDFFSGKRMINLDSEELGVIIISSAGGGGTEYSIPISREPPGGWEGLSVEVGGLLGGHSGVDIHLPRLNANILLAQGLRHLGAETPVRLVHIDGGTRGNAIPRSAKAEVLVPEGKAAKATKVIEEWASGLDRSEEEIEVKASKATPKPAVDLETSKRALDLISEIPQGVYSWSEEYEGLVQTSNNLGILRTEEERIRVPVNSRTSDAEDFKGNQEMLRELGGRHGVEFTQRAGGAGWKASPDSPFLKLVVRCYDEVYGSAAKVEGIHGGLECGVFVRLDPELQIVSLGPTIHNPHSPSEYLEASTVGVLWEVVRDIAQRMDEE
ncbi:beta-Ala-His dipeptidase [archaeon]|nr:beta-Ala-His dipeptidase [archaeon]